MCYDIVLYHTADVIPLMNQGKSCSPVIYTDRKRRLLDRVMTGDLVVTCHCIPTTWIHTRNIDHLIAWSRPSSYCLTIEFALNKKQTMLIGLIICISCVIECCNLSVTSY